MAHGPAYERCEDCGAVIHPHRVACPVCGSRRLVDERSAGRGAVIVTSTERARTLRRADVVELYDAFTINPILFLEDLGFCAKGEGGPFVAGGGIAPGGCLPVNTNGGGLCYTHPGMLGIFLIMEAVRQLRGEAGERQRPGTDVALVHGNGGALSAQATALLGTAATL